MDLTSQTEDENVENNNDILFVKNIDMQKKTDDTEMQEAKQTGRGIAKRWKQVEKNFQSPKRTKNSKLKRSHGDPKIQVIFTIRKTNFCRGECHPAWIG